MPAIMHLHARFLSSTGTSGINATVIGLIVGLGLIPAFILIWVVIWLLFFYPSDRNCCCVKRKRRSDTPEMLEQGGNTDASQEAVYEKAIYDLPQRPFAAHARTESGSSSVTGRLTKPDPNKSTTAVSKTDTRMSMYSVASASTVQCVQEPKPFV